MKATYKELENKVIAYTCDITTKYLSGRNFNVYKEIEKYDAKLSVLLEISEETLPLLEKVNFSLYVMNVQRNVRKVLILN